MQLKPITAIIVLLLVVASLLVSGCTIDFPKAPLPTPPPTPSPTVTTPTPTPTPAVLVSAKEVTVPQQIAQYAPKAGNKFVGFNCTIQNIAASSRLQTNPYYWQLRDTTGGVYQPTTATFSDALSGRLQTIETQPGDIVRGVIVYEVPQNAQLKSITYTGSSNIVIIDLGVWV